MAAGAAGGGGHLQDALPQQADTDGVAPRRLEQVKYSLGSMLLCEVGLYFIFILFSSLQKEHDGFREWLQSKEKESVVLDKVRPLFKELQDER